MKTDAKTQVTKFQAIKGVRDILPPESALWNQVEQAAREVFATYGYGEIRLPIFEQTELFARSIGAETDVVSKEMYTFEDRPAELTSSPMIGDLPSYIGQIGRLMESGVVPRTEMNVSVLGKIRGLTNELLPLGERTVENGAEKLMNLIDLVEDLQLGPSVSLRPEATASVVRAYIEHGMQTLPSPIKLYYMGPMFRRERPQKGRYRQFYQIGAEILGPNIAHFSIDADVITMLMSFFDRSGLNGHVLHINSIGCKECRAAYVLKLRSALEQVREKLGPDSQRRIETNTLRVLDSKVPEEQPIIEELPKISDSLCRECQDHFEGLKRLLRERGIEFKVNPRLVRGLDYYVRTTFEVTAPGQGSQDAICGGGRYDGLVELIGGAKFREIKGVGFAIGEDRLIEALKFEGAKVTSRVDVLVAWKGEDSREHAEKLAQILRLVGLVVEVPVKAMSPGEGLGLANRRNIPIGVVVGPDEVSAATFSLRLLSEGEQVALTELQVSRIRRLLKLRLLLEAKLQDWAIMEGIDYKNLPIADLAAKLVNAQVFPGWLKMLVSMASETFNTLIHGGDVSQERESEAVAASLRVLDELAAKGPKLPFRIG